MAEATHEDGASLIRQAFERARERGLPSWETMTTAVLKNRLLDLTSGKFKESDWDAATFREFVEQFDDIVALDPETRPARVVLRQKEQLKRSTGGTTVASRTSRDIGAHRQIRPDLWTSVLDFRSGSRYEWDGKQAVASDDGAAKASRVLPTLTKDEFKQWRSDFVSVEKARAPEMASRLDAWLDQEQSLMQLPTAIRISWVVELKRRVLERLEAWFRDNDLELPADMVVSDIPKESRVDVDALREHVLAAVRKMSRAELEALQLPATVFLRGKD